MKMKLNEEQQLAVEEFSTDLLVMASAGTGKTRVLTQKYLHLLASRKCEVPQIVAVTFTHKAAGEMRARIREEMKNAAENSSGADREYWLRQLELVEVSAKITTIHGLCLSILKQHPIEAGINPQVKILGEGEEDLFKAKAASSALSCLLAADQDGTNLPVVLALGAEFFLRALPALYTVIKEAGAEIPSLSPHALPAPSDAKLTDLKTKLKSGLFRLQQMAGEVKLTPRAQDLLTTLFTQWPTYQKELQNMERLTASGLQVMGDLLAFLPKNLNKQLRPEIDQIHTLVEALKANLVTREAVAQTPTLLAFLHYFDGEYTRLKQLEGKLDFTDQQFLVRRLLRDHPALTDEFRRRFAYLMVDEFQDTNSLQWEIIQLLSGEEAPEGKLFLVGDLKQSIYRFRGAEVEIMTGLADSKFNRRGQVMALTKNYRTLPNVAEVVNSFCRSIFASEAFPYQPIVPMAKDDPQKATGVEILLAPENEPAMLAARIRRLVESGAVQVRAGETRRPVQYGDVAVLFRTKTHLKAFESAFRAQGLPYQVTAGVGFYARQEIQDHLNLLRLVECPEDALALGGVLRSPFCQLSDTALFWLAHPHGLTTGFLKGKKATDYPKQITEPERRRLARLRQLIYFLSQNAHLLSIPELLRSAWNATGYLETVAALPEGDRLLANLEKLIVRAEDFATMGYSGVGDFVTFLSHLSAIEVREGEASALHGEGNFMQIMTIHAAKGLEFPVVVIPELDAKFNLSTRSTVFYHEKWGVIHKVMDPDGSWLHTERTTEFTEEEKRAERSELKRLFYVGMTRARDYLLLSATEKEVKAKTIDEGQSWWDWLTLVLPDLTAAEAGELTIDDQRLKLTRAVPQAVIPSVEPKAVPLEADESAAALDLTLATGKMTTKRLSLTPLLTFQECPRRFFWQHRLGSDPATVPQVEAGTTEEAVSPNFGLILGEVFHRLISGPTGGREAVEPANAGWFHGLTPPEQQVALAQLRIMQENYLSSPFVPEAGVRMENELPFVLSLRGVIIKGIIDRVLFYPDGRMVVVDFKTNRRLPPPGKIRDRYYFQVNLYALALREIYQRLPTEAWIYFVRPNLQLPCALTDQNLDATEEQIVKTVEYITTHDLPADYPPGEDCEFCPFTVWCQEVVSSSQ
ncbi:MAG TPA: hypothetical protein DDZ55_03325 [Firmicutes bacterium]|nr:hypothetical protein [Bacillota bacterium]